MIKSNISFRGKSIESGKWIYGDLLHIGEDSLYISENPQQSGNIEEVIPDSVGQYIGLNTRKGTRIYEGDILKIPYTMKNGGTGVTIGVVSWNQYCLGVLVETTKETILFSSPVHDLRLVEILGNKTDNQELINETF